jgi:cytochrome c-type biogenesis protein CcmH
MTPTIASLREQLQQLQARADRAELDAEAHAATRAPLERQLVALVMANDSVAVTASPALEAPATPRPSRRLQWGLAASVLLCALAGYAWKGTPGAFGLGTPPGPAAELAQIASADGQQVTAAQITEMVDKLAARLKEKPDDAVGWTMLARAYSALGRFGDAVPAYQQAIAQAGEDAGLLTDYADALAAQNNGKLDGEPLKLVQRALVLDPKHVKALALAGTAAYDSQDYAGAVRQWEQVAAILPADSPFQQQVHASIAEARNLGGMPAGPAAPMAPAAPALAAAPAAAPGSTPAGAVARSAASSALSGTVSLAPAIAAQAKPEDTVFVLARAANGPRMPLAVLRKQVKDLPLRFTLDDSMAMAPTAKISDHPQVIVIARISKSGNAIPQPGDLSGQSAAVAPGTSGIAVEIRELVGP